MGTQAVLFPLCLSPPPFLSLPLSLQEKGGACNSRRKHPPLLLCPSNLCLFRPTILSYFHIVAFHFLLSCSGWASNLGLESFGVRSVLLRALKRGGLGHGKCVQLGGRNIGEPMGMARPGLLLTMDESKMLQANAESQTNREELLPLTGF
ncbi:hypothetical protein HDV57DRAFT_38814 [Trichoderma longibrachiatum]|uniref:Uncharacterized protein n=1 Tax=Trichoderma longibrachiatum ATCC 18648 TaxID=983965 RepID=A0A2T4CHJ3_TRILO|nr:hypothetical protein M440DRAFT_74953 [Trichoderma longibrachiatum ATCC 18648]